MVCGSLYLLFNMVQNFHVALYARYGKSCRTHDLLTNACVLLPHFIEVLFKDDAVFVEDKLCLLDNKQYLIYSLFAVVYFLLEHWVYLQQPLLLFTLSAEEHIALEVLVGS